MKRCSCCDTNHTDWAALPYVGVQVFPACGEYAEERLELRNCTVCNSTLSRAVGTDTNDTDTDITS